MSSRLQDTLGPGVWGTPSCSHPTCKRKLSSGSDARSETPLSPWKSVFGKNNSSWVPNGWDPNPKTVFARL